MYIFTSAYNKEIISLDKVLAVGEIEKTSSGDWSLIIEYFGGDAVILFYDERETATRDIATICHALTDEKEAA
jgi:hypothetical protein